MEKIVLFSEYLTLGQALKELGVISTGGQAKYFLKGQKILVNNQSEDRRGRKLYNNDVLTLPDNRKILLRSSTSSEQENYEKELIEKKKIKKKVKQLNTQPKKSNVKRNKPQFPGDKK